MAHSIPPSAHYNGANALSLPAPPYADYAQQRILACHGYPPPIQYPFWATPGGPVPYPNMPFFPHQWQAYYMQSGASGPFPQAYYTQPPAPVYDQRSVGYSSDMYGPARPMFCPLPYAQAPYYPHEQEAPMHHAPYYHLPASAFGVPPDTRPYDRAEFIPAHPKETLELAPSLAYACKEEEEEEEEEEIACYGNSLDPDMASLETELMKLLETSN